MGYSSLAGRIASSSHAPAGSWGLRRVCRWLRAFEKASPGILATWADRACEREKAIMEVLITGASGLLGHHLITALQERGDHVRALVLPREDASRLEARGVRIFRGDTRQPDTLTDPCAGVDTMFHLAGMMGLWLPMEAYRAVNVGGTGDICRAARRAAVRR